MCLIIQLKDKTVNITEEEFKTNLMSNPHGTGLMFANNGKVIVKKALTNRQSQIDLFKKYSKSIAQGGIKEVFFHSRLATHGAKDEANCHPYEVLTKEENNNTELWCMHNGVINCDNKEAQRSDTYNFLTYYLKPVLKGRLELLDNEYFVKMIEDFIGASSKLVFLDSTGKSVFINKKAGVDYKGAWISNTYSGISETKQPAKNRVVNKGAVGGYYANRTVDYDEDNFYWGGYRTPIVQAPVIKKEVNVCETKENKEVKEVVKEIVKEVEVKQNPVINLSDAKKKESGDFETKAVNTGIKLLIAAFKTMTHKELFNFILAEPLIASEVLNELLEGTNIYLEV